MLRENVRTWNIDSVSSVLSVDATLSGNLSSADHLQEVRDISLQESKSIERATYQMQNHESEIGFTKIIQKNIRTTRYRA